jgi:hypothetical protein
MRPKSLTLLGSLVLRIRCSATSVGGEVLEGALCEVRFAPLQEPSLQFLLLPPPCVSLPVLSACFVSYAVVTVVAAAFVIFKSFIVLRPLRSSFCDSFREGAYSPQRSKNLESANSNAWRAYPTARD